MTHLILRGNALAIPLRDESVDLVVTSPPYFALRSYRDNGEHFEGQLGSEAHPQQFLEALWAVMRECWRVLKPEGSCFINLGDKRAGSGGHNNSGVSTSKGSNFGLSGGPQYSHKPVAREQVATRRNAPDRYAQAHFGRRKSRQALPERFLIGCMDGLADPEGIGWIHRQTIIWEKPNGLPESVTDRTRDNFEFVYHFTKSGRYFAAMDEIREPSVSADRPQGRSNGRTRMEDATGSAHNWSLDTLELNPLGKIPGSVWRIASEPLRIPDLCIEDDRGWRMWGTKPYGKPRKIDDGEAPEGLFPLSDVPKGMKVIPELVALWKYVEQRLAEGYEGPIRVGDLTHFAAFPSELPRRLILAFTPSGICTACGEPRRPMVEKELRPNKTGGSRGIASRAGHMDLHDDGVRENSAFGLTGKERFYGYHEAAITGYACRCPDTSAPTRKAVVLDPFMGTGTTPMVAEALGRVGIGLDLSEDYCRLAKWRIEESGGGAKAEQRTWKEAQGQLI